MFKRLLISRLNWQITLGAGMPPERKTLVSLPSESWRNENSVPGGPESESAENTGTGGRASLVQGVRVGPGRRPLWQRSGGSRHDRRRPNQRAVKRK